MRISRTSLILLAGMLLLLACRPAIDLENEKAALLQADRDFAKTSIERGAAEAFNAFLADSAMMMSGGAEPVVGRQIIYERMKGSKAKFVLDWVPQDGEVAQSGELGWTWGKSVNTVQKDDGTSEKHYGKYLDVWKKQPDGSWKVIIDIGNGSPAPEEAK